MGKHHQKHRTLFVKKDLKTLNCSFDIKKAFYLFMKNFKKIFCPICGCGSIFNHSKDYLYIKECKGCKIVFTHPLPEGLTEAYDEDYYKIWYEKQLRQRVKLWRRRLKVVKKFCKSDRLLNMGTGDGFFLKVAKKTANFNVCGTEISHAAMRAAKNLYDLDIQLTEIENADFEENSFDVITIWHVIEHVKNQLAVLKKVYSLSKPGAVDFIATPNLDKHVSRIIYHKIENHLEVHNIIVLPINHSLPKVMINLYTLRVS